MFYKKCILSLQCAWMNSNKNRYPITKGHYTVKKEDTDFFTLLTLSSIHFQFKLLIKDDLSTMTKSQRVPEWLTYKEKSDL